MNEGERSSLATLVPRLPYPLAYNLGRLLSEAARRDEGESVPLFPYSICALNGLVVRLAAAIGIQSYVRWTGARDTDVNRKVMDGLRAPADGTWRDIALLTLRVAAGTGGAAVATRLFEGLTKHRSRSAFGARSAAEGLQALVTYRNRLIHGDRLSEGETDAALSLVLRVVQSLTFLAEYEVRVRSGGKGFRLTGIRPSPLAEEPRELPEGEPCLVQPGSGEPALSLSPLLVFREGTPDGSLEFDELFFLNAGVLERLNYVAFRYSRPMDGRQLGTYAAFRRFVQAIPTPPSAPEPRIDFGPLAQYHARLFVGREGVLDALERFVDERPSPYGVVTAPAGMGKTALLARLFERHAKGRPRHIWAFHFCMPTDGRESPVVALRSLIAQLCDGCGLDRRRYLSHDLTALKESFSRVLDDASGSLPSGGRVVVVVDALDEGIPAGSLDSIPSVLPEQVPGHVVFLVSWRVDAGGRNTRVDRELAAVPPASRGVIEGASPLAGLTRENVAEFLSRVVEGAPVPERSVEAAWRAASADGNGADPFFLRFVADGAESGRVDVTRAETIPESLDEAFDELWMGLPDDRDFLVHRILSLLAVMREYGSDELFVDLLGRETPPGSDPLTAAEVASLRVRAGKLLVYDGDRYGLFHDRFRKFLVGDQPDPVEAALGGA